MAYLVRIPILALALAAACVGDDSSSGPMGSGRSLSPAACLAPPSDMVAWWPGDDHANDIEGFSHGSLQNGAGFAAAQVDAGFSLDGSDDHVLIGNPAALQLTTGITVDAWVRPTASRSNGTLAGVLTKWAQDATLSPTGDSWALWLQSTGADFQIFTGVHVSSGAEPILSGGIVPLNVWTHVAMTYDAATGFFAAYVNGALVASTDGDDLPIHATSASVAIGREISGQTRHFPGQIDEVEVFSRALSAAEIDAIVAAGADGKCKPSCFGITVTTTGTPDGMGGLNLTAGDDVWVGTDGAETVFGLGGDDRMCALDGADVLFGDAGNDLIDAGAGDDEVMGGADDDVLHGGPGADTMDGEDGNDTLYGDAGADTLSGGAGSDLIVGDDGDDVIDGGADPDQLYGFAGADSIRGGGGNDVLKGGNDGDVLLGEEGRDALQGQAGDDRLDGGSENDGLIGGPGADHHAGGDGVDQARKFSCAENDTWDGTVERGIPPCAVLAM